MNRDDKLPGVEVTLEDLKELNDPIAWQHVKRGSLYKIIGVWDGWVTYLSYEFGKVWRREVSEFLDGRYVARFIVPKPDPINPIEVG